MKGVVFEAVGSAPKIVDNIPEPKPGAGQVLVKSLYTSLNPVDGMMAYTGLLVTAWPITLGCDAGGEVVELGHGVTHLKVGDHVLGCTRLGTPGYGTFQEKFLVDEKLIVKVPSTFGEPLVSTCTVGVGIYTAALGVYNGLAIKPGDSSAGNGEWAIVLGASGNVGGYTVQLLTLAGFRVLGSCSTSKAKAVMSLGAAATVDYKTPADQLIVEIKSITGGKFSRVLDASATSNALALRALTEASTASGTKHYSTANDWDPVEPPQGSGIKVDTILLGPIGRPEAPQINNLIESYIPTITDLLAQSKLRTGPYKVVGKGFEGIVEALGAKAGAEKTVVEF